MQQIILVFRFGLPEWSSGLNLGDDLAEGKPTLPLIRALTTATPERASVVHEAILQRNATRLADVSETVRLCGALEYTTERAKMHRDRAMEALGGLTASPFRDNLLQIAELSVARQG